MIFHGGKNVFMVIKEEVKKVKMFLIGIKWFFMVIHIFSVGIK
jgi:hypothetical protein